MPNAPAKMIPGAFADEIALLAHGISAPFRQTRSPNEYAIPPNRQVRPCEMLCEKLWGNRCACRLRIGGFLRLFGNCGAGKGNRTPLASLGSWCITTMLYPRSAAAISCPRPFQHPFALVNTSCGRCCIMNRAPDRAGAQERAQSRDAGRAGPGRAGRGGAGQAKNDWACLMPPPSRTYCGPFTFCGVLRSGVWHGHVGISQGSDR